MDRDEVIAELREYEVELKALGALPSPKECDRE